MIPVRKSVVCDMVEHLESCIKAAIVEGFKGEDEDYQFVQADREYVVGQLGFNPTEDEWTLALEKVRLPF
jgi:hypothetical protein